MDQSLATLRNDIKDRIQNLRRTMKSAEFWSKHRPAEELFNCHKNDKQAAAISSVAFKNIALPFYVQNLNEAQIRRRVFVQEDKQMERHAIKKRKLDTLISPRESGVKTIKWLCQTMLRKSHWSLSAQPPTQDETIQTRQAQLDKSSYAIFKRNLRHANSA